MKKNILAFVLLATSLAPEVFAGHPCRDLISPVYEPILHCNKNIDPEVIKGGAQLAINDVDLCVYVYNNGIRKLYYLEGKFYNHFIYSSSLDGLKEKKNVIKFVRKIDNGYWGLNFFWVNKSTTMIELLDQGATLTHKISNRELYELKRKVISFKVHCNYL